MPKPEIQADSQWFRIIFRRRVDGSEKSSDKSSENTADLILVKLVKRPDMTILELATALNLSTRAVEKQIARLKKSGRLTRVGSRKQGRWLVK